MLHLPLLVISVPLKSSPGEKHRHNEKARNDTNHNPKPPPMLHISFVITEQVIYDGEGHFDIKSLAQATANWQ